MSCKISVGEFREHFEGVTAERYKLEPEAIQAALEGKCSLRQIKNFRVANVNMKKEVT